MPISKAVSLSLSSCLLSARLSLFQSRKLDTGNYTQLWYKQFKWHHYDSTFKLLHAPWTCSLYRDTETLLSHRDTVKRYCVMWTFSAAIRQHVTQERAPVGETTPATSHSSQWVRIHVFYLHATVCKATTFKISQCENALQGLILKQFNFVLSRFSTMGLAIHRSLTTSFKVCVSVHSIVIVIVLLPVV